MRKLTIFHYTMLKKEMRNAIMQYANAYFAKEIEDSMLQMYAEDIANANAALAQFISTRDAAELHSAIMYYDTAVREEFINVLLYIEQNKLIAAEDFCVL